MKVNKTTIISSLFLALSITAPVALQTVTPMDGEIIPTRHTTNKIKFIELGSDTSTIVLDAQGALNEDEVLTAGYDQSSWTSYDGLQTSDLSGMLGQGDDVQDNTFAHNIDFYQDQKDGSDGNEVNKMVVEQIAAGETFSSALVKEWDEMYPDGIMRAYMWGGDINNVTIPELGSKPEKDPQETKSYTTPVTIDLDGDGNDGMEVKGVLANGYDHAAAKAYDPDGNLGGGTSLPGQLFVWGQNDLGQVGAGTSDSTVTPTLIPDTVFGDSDGTQGSDEITFKDVEFGLRDSFAIVHNSVENKDHLYAWGDNQYGQLGLIGEDHYQSPQEVKLRGFDGELISVVPAEKTTYLLTKDVDGVYDVWGWGTNNKKALGTKKNGSAVGENDRTAPIKLDVLGENKEIGNDYKITGLYSNMMASTVFVTIEDSKGMNHAFSWGDNSAGQMGTWDQMGMTSSAVPTELDSNGDGVYGTENNIKQIAVGDSSVAALYESKDGTKQEVYMWGDNSKGMFGWGDRNLGDKLTPSLVWTYNEQALNVITDSPQLAKTLALVFMILAILFLITTIIMLILWVLAKKKDS